MDRLRFVICDNDGMLSSMVDAMITEHGHDVVGIADSTSTAVGLVQQGHPDVVVVDPSIGINADFDVVEVALSNRAKVIAFGRSSESLGTDRYSAHVQFIAKPDLVALEHAIDRLRLDHDEVTESDRRHRPARAAAGPRPTGPSDAAAFYASLNEGVEGDAVVALAPRAAGVGIDPSALADLFSGGIRDTDRLLVGGSSVIVLLPGGGREAIDSLFARFSSDTALSADIEFRSVILAAGESPNDAFDRLKRDESSVR
jgi:chemotaxis response regulator CheB